MNKRQLTKRDIKIALLFPFSPVLLACYASLPLSVLHCHASKDWRNQGFSAHHQEKGCQSLSRSRKTMKKWSLKFCCSRYLYTLVITCKEKAEKLMHSLPRFGSEGADMNQMHRTVNKILKCQEKSSWNMWKNSTSLTRDIKLKLTLSYPQD